MPGSAHDPRRTAAMVMAALPRAVRTPGRDIRPFGVCFRQTASNRVSHDISPLCAVAIVRPDAVIERPRLPSHLAAIAGGPLEFTNDPSDTYGFWDDGYQVNVVWHREKEQRLPDPMMSKMGRRLDEQGPLWFACELISTPYVSADGDEYGVASGGPGWAVVS